MQEPFNIYPYQRVGEKEENQAIGKDYFRQRLIWFWRYWSRPGALVCIFIAFVLGRGVVGEQIVPFGIAFLVAVLRQYRPLALPVLVAILLGEGTAGLRDLFWYHGLTYISLIFSFQLLANNFKRSLWLGIFTACWTFGFKAGFSTVLFQPLTYDYLKIALEALLGGALVPPFLVVLRGLREPRQDFGRLQEEMGSLLLFILAILLGLNFSVGGYNLGIIFSKYLILLAGLGGPGWGAALGGICGLLPGLVHVNGLLLAGLYSISGMLAGFLKHWGKLGLLMGFFCGNFLYGFYFNDQALLIDFLETSALAAVLLLLTPKRVTHALAHNWFKPKKEIKPSASQLEDRVERIAALFKDLAGAYSQAAVVTTKNDTRQKLLGEIYHRVCVDCPMARICWEKEGEETYQQLLIWLDTMEVKGRENAMNYIPDDLGKRCRKIDELGNALNFFLAMEEASSFWREKTNKERKAMAAQLLGAAQALGAARQEWSLKEWKHRDLEEGIRIELEELGYTPQKIQVWPGTDPSFELLLEIKPCQKGKSICVDPILAGLEGVLGHPLIMERHNCYRATGEKPCSFRFLTLASYKPEVGFAQWPKEGQSVCGDSLAAIGLDQNKWLFVLSDGMGSGEAAFNESNWAVHLLVELLSLDFPLAEAVKMVNSILLLNQEERFATIDVFIFDFLQQTLEFVKVGAPPSLLIQGGRCHVLATNSPPAGILEEILVETVSLQFQSDACLIMVSDGIWQGEDQEDWLPGFIQGIWQLPPEELAGKIVEHGLILHGGKAGDDLSALVVRVSKV